MVLRIILIISSKIVDLITLIIITTTPTPLTHQIKDFRVEITNLIVSTTIKQIIIFNKRINFTNKKTMVLSRDFNRRIREYIRIRIDLITIIISINNFSQNRMIKRFWFKINNRKMSFRINFQWKNQFKNFQRINTLVNQTLTILLEIIMLKCNNKILITTTRITTETNPTLKERENSPNWTVAKSLNQIFKKNNKCKILTNPNNTSILICCRI